MRDCAVVAWRAFELQPMDRAGSSASASAAADGLSRWHLRPPPLRPPMDRAGSSASAFSRDHDDGPSSGMLWWWMVSQRMMPLIIMLGRGEWKESGSRDVSRSCSAPGRKKKGDVSEEVTLWCRKKPRRSDSPRIAEDVPATLKNSCSCCCCEDMDPGFEEGLVEIAGEEIRMVRCACTVCPARNGGKCRAVLALVPGEEDQHCWACESTHSDVGVSAHRRISVFTNQDSTFTRTQRSFHVTDNGQ